MEVDDWSALEEVIGFMFNSSKFIKLSTLKNIVNENDEIIAKFLNNGHLKFKFCSPGKI